MTTTLKGEGREGQAYLRTQNGSPVYDETWHYIVEASSTSVTRPEVILTPGLPRRGQSVSPSGIGLCQGIRCQRRPLQPLIWDVTVEFSSDIQDQQSNPDPQSDPEAWIPIYETKFERLQEIVTKDLNGDSIANSAGQPFQTGMTRTRFIPVWEFFQLEPASVTDEAVIARNETVNSASFKGRAAKTLLCVVLSSQVGFFYGSRRRLSRYALKYNAQKWTHKRLDVGTVFLSGSNLEPYLDNAGNVILGPLNGSGAKATAGDPPSTLEFDMHTELNFSTFLRI